MTRARPGLMRSRRDRMLAGVCGGLAQWLGWSPGLVRVLFVLVSILSAAFPGILVYLILWVVMPQRDDEEFPLGAG
jgi:phage shock protein C